MVLECSKCLHKLKEIFTSINTFISSAHCSVHSQHAVRFSFITNKLVI
jgi:hypothetical protein